LPQPERLVQVAGRLQQVVVRQVDKGRPALVLEVPEPVAERGGFSEGGVSLAAQLLLLVLQGEEQAVRLG
jgi:hypothetical protein